MSRPVDGSVDGVRRYSLRARLLWFLLAAIAAAAAVQAFIAYRAARAEADAIFDYHMQQMALSLRARFPLSIVPGVADELGDAEGFDFLVQIWTLDGTRIFRTAGPQLPQRAVLGFSQERVDGHSYRTYAMQGGVVVIQIAQDMAVRRRMAGAMALRTLAPVALMAPVLMLLVWAVVGVSLAPVARAQRQLAQRQPEDLGEISEAGLPDEVRPLVHELNLLFGRVRAAFEAQQSFVADAAHELRSPLAALRLQVQGLQRAGDEATRGRMLERLVGGIDRASRLVDQLLVLARQQAGASARVVGQGPDRARGPGPWQPLALAVLVRQVVGEAAAAAQARGIDLGVVHADELEVQGDAQALAILVRNLVDNAIKYTPQGGRVDVELRRLASSPAAAAGGAARLLVQDSGPGIPATELERVRDRFYRIPGSEVEGSGLGLAIVDAIAQAHGARLVLRASSTLGGLCAQVDFPLHAGEAAGGDRSP
ncbi:MAG TPA: ATP-binding protein [Rubrivivax sp.]|nr:ATP-binding protein [Rubrivivax sp.]